MVKVHNTRPRTRTRGRAIGEAIGPRAGKPDKEEGTPLGDFITISGRNRQLRRRDINGATVRGQAFKETTGPRTRRFIKVKEAPPSAHAETDQARHMHPQPSETNHQSR
ncbi:hypothetical protein BGX31_010524, partial [Mortierella sp. GBA43]